MRHRKSGKRLGVPSNRRKAMLKQLVEALFLHGRIQTTLTRAKAIRPVAERVITWAKRGSLHNRRRAMSMIPRKDVVNRIFDSLVAWYKDRPGGYTRIIKIGPRAGDAATIVFLELVDWIPGAKLPGQHTKTIKVAEEEKSGKTEDKDKPVKEKAKLKEKKKLAAKSKPGVKKAERKTEEKKPEKERKISERKTEKEKIKKERAVVREKIKKEKTEQKTKSKAAAPKPAAKKTGKVTAKASKVKQAKKKTSKPTKKK